MSEQLWRPWARVVWLGVVSGAADAAGWVGSGVFPAHMTGNTALIGVAVLASQWHLAAIRLATVASFVCGLVLAAALGTRRGAGTTLSIAVAAGFALAAALARTAPADVLLLAVALAMQNATLHQFAGKSINTSFLTGSLQSWALALGRHAVGRAKPDDRTGDAVLFRLVPSVWLAYVAGAGIGAGLASVMHHPLLPIALAIPAVLLLRRGEAGAS